MEVWQKIASRRDKLWFVDFLIFIQRQRFKIVSFKKGGDLVTVTTIDGLFDIFRAW